MKLAVFSPAAKRSAIGRVVALVTRVLCAEGHQVTIVRTEDIPYVDSSRHDFPCEVVAWTSRSDVEQVLRLADAIVHHIGNSYEFHRGALQWLPETGGLVCLHDFFLGHLFWAWSEGRREDARRVLRRWYGDAAADHYFAFTSHEAFIDGTHRRAPMVEWVVSMADGVLTHSGWDIERVLRACGGPVSVAALPYDAPSAAAGGAPDSSRCVVLTFGQINPNKRAESVICAMGANDQLRNRAEYWLAGRIQPELSAHLALLAERMGVRLITTGEVDDATLRSMIARADVICCVRLPALEAASASAIEAMLYGKPVIVADTGFYRDLPDDCVIKIDPADELRTIQAALVRMLENEAERSALGSRAAAWAHATFTAESYAAEMLSVCESVWQAAPFLASARWFADTLVQWGAEAPELGEPLLLKPLGLLTAASGRPSARKR